MPRSWKSTPSSSSSPVDLLGPPPELVDVLGRRRYESSFVEAQFAVGVGGLATLQNGQLQPVAETLDEPLEGDEVAGVEVTIHRLAVAPDFAYDTTGGIHQLEIQIVVGVAVLAFLAARQEGETRYRLSGLPVCDRVVFLAFGH